jgi:hypothetical protein
MLAYLLYVLLGPRAAFAELSVELLMCLVLFAGGGGGRVRRVLADWLPRRRARTATADAPG